MVCSVRSKDRSTSSHIKRKKHKKLRIIKIMKKSINNYIITKIIMQKFSMRYNWKNKKMKMIGTLKNNSTFIGICKSKTIKTGQLIITTTIINFILTIKEATIIKEHKYLCHHKVLFTNKWISKAIKSILICDFFVIIFYMKFSFEIIESNKNQNKYQNR